MTKRHPAARKRPPKRQEEADDVFVAKVLETSTWIQKNTRLLTVAGIVLVVLVASGLYYRNYRADQLQRAAERLEQIHQSITLQDKEGARQELVTFLAQFGNTPQAQEARLLLGQLYLEENEPQQAIAVLEPLASSPRKPLELQGAVLLAAAYEQDGRIDEAEDLYLTIADRSELEFQITESLARAARIRKTKGDAEGAVELYRRILDDLDENDQRRGLWEMRLQEVEAARNI